MTTQEDLNNVIDIRTRQSILPSRIRSILKGQYVEAKDQDYDPDTFVSGLEQRLLSELARTTIETTKSWLEGQKFGGGK